MIDRAELAGTIYHWCMIQGWGHEFAESQSLRVLADTGPEADWLSDLLSDIKKGANDRWN